MWSGYVGGEGPDQNGGISKKRLWLESGDVVEESGGKSRKNQTDRRNQNKTSGTCCDKNR